MDAFQSILKFFLNQKTAIGYSFMALLTVGSERLFSLVAFKCPCSTENTAYGLVFLFAPAWVLLILGFFLNNKAWRLFTGCCINPKKIFPRRHRCRFFYVLGHITLSSLVAPVMWLSVALLNGTFYECAMSGTRSARLLELICKGKPKECQEDLYKVSCGKSSMTPVENEEVKLSLQAQSQEEKFSSKEQPMARYDFPGTLYRDNREIITLKLDMWRWQEPPLMSSMKLSFGLRNDEAPSRATANKRTCWTVNRQSSSCRVLLSILWQFVFHIQ
ncbi:hypothetical protein STEG23_009339 [Scotinomys teguina]